MSLTNEVPYKDFLDGGGSGHGVLLRPYRYHTVYVIHALGDAFHTPLQGNVTRVLVIRSNVTSDSNG